MSNSRKKIINRYKYNKLLLFALFVATLFMGVGYAAINSVSLEVVGSAKAFEPSGLFISEVSYLQSVNADQVNSKVNSSVKTMIDSQIFLQSDVNSSITYQVKVFNNTDQSYLFVGALSDKEFYDNDNIKFSYTVLNAYDTTILPRETIIFELTFSYDLTKEDLDLSKNSLSSKINFRFVETPVLDLSNDNQAYTLSDIYPNYEAKSYEFSVSNYDGTNLNAVPMSYYFSIDIDKPLVAKIYDELGSEVVDSVNLSGDGQAIDHVYTLKILWDDSNDEYNLAEYAGKDFNCEVKLIAIPDGDKYLDYKVEKGFNVNVSTASLYFDIDMEKEVNVKSATSTLPVTIKAFLSSSEYNAFDLDYELYLEKNSKFMYSVDGVSANKFNRSISKGSDKTDKFNIEFTTDLTKLDATEIVNLRFVVTKPYVKEYLVPVNFNLKKVTISFDANGGSVSPTSLQVINGMTYGNLPIPTWVGHTFDGWYTEATGGTKISDSTVVSVSSTTQTLYAHWTSRLLADLVSLGEYVNYPVNYSNVATRKDGTLYAKNTGWRVVGFDYLNGKKYVKLISAGVPLTYRHAAIDSTSANTSVNNLINNFLNLDISTSSANYTFNSCGIKTSTGASVTTKAQLKTVFTNNFTQLSSGVPIVRSVIKEDLTALGLTVDEMVPLQNSYLFTLEAATASGGYSYAGYFLGSKYDNTYMYAIYYSGYILHTYGLNGVRPVVYLNPEVTTTGKVNEVWQLES